MSFSRINFTFKPVDEEEDDEEEDRDEEDDDVEDEDDEDEPSCSRKRSRAIEPRRGMMGIGSEQHHWM